MIVVAITYYLTACCYDSQMSLHAPSKPPFDRNERIVLLDDGSTYAMESYPTNRRWGHLASVGYAPSLSAKDHRRCLGFALSIAQGI